MKSKISLVQKNVMNPLPRPADEEYTVYLDELAESSVIIFPEYFAFHKGLGDLNDFINYSAIALEWLKDFSKHPRLKDSMVIGGSVLVFEDQRLYNATPVIFAGEVLAYYYKRRLFGHEEGNISRGKKATEVTHPASGKKWGILICADVFLSGAFRQHQACDYIAVPTSSPFRPQDTSSDQNHRDREIFLQGAKESNTIIFKCCSVGSIGAQNPHGGPPARVQGRSLICDQNDILERAPGIYWSGLIHYDPDTGKTALTKLQEVLPHSA